MRVERQNGNEGNVGGAGGEGVVDIVANVERGCGIALAEDFSKPSG